MTVFTATLTSSVVPYSAVKPSARAVPPRDRNVQDRLRKYATTVATMKLTAFAGTTGADRKSSSR
jgi:hypothetical protein